MDWVCKRHCDWNYEKLITFLIPFQITDYYQNEQNHENSSGINSDTELDSNHNQVTGKVIDLMVKKKESKVLNVSLLLLFLIDWIISITVNLYFSFQMMALIQSPSRMMSFIYQITCKAITCPCLICQLTQQMMTLKFNR